MKFDPMTGEPINEDSEPTLQFDPMTGEPIKKDSQPAMQFDPMTGQPVTGQQKKNSKLPKILGIAAAALAALAVLVIVLINAFMPASVKVSAAIGNTFTDMPYIVRDLKSVPSIMASNKMAAGISGSFDNNNVSLEFMRSGKEFQAVLGIDGDDVKDFKFTAALNADKVSLYAPKIDKRVFVYNYNKSNSGHLGEMDNIDELNDYLKSLSKSNSAMDDYVKDMATIIMKELKNAKFEKISSKSFKINDKSTECKGYRLKINDKLVKSILTSMRDKINKKYKDEFTRLLELDGSDYDIDEFFDEMIDDLDYMEDVTASFYIKGNKLAAVIFESDDGEEISIEFRGGDYRIQNTVITCNYGGSYEETIKLKGSVSDNVEKLKLSFEDSYGSSEEIMSVKYDYKKGDFEIEIDDVSVKGKLKASASEVKADIERIEMPDYKYTEPISVYINKKPSLTKIKGKEFDLGNADEDDLEELWEDLEDSIDDLDIDDLLWTLYDLDIY